MYLFIKSNPRDQYWYRHLKTLIGTSLQKPCLHHVSTKLLLLLLLKVLFSLFICNFGIQVSSTYLFMCDPKKGEHTLRVG